MSLTRTPAAEFSLSSTPADFGKAILAMAKVLGAKPTEPTVGRERTEVYWKPHWHLSKTYWKWKRQIRKQNKVRTRRLL